MYYACATQYGEREFVCKFSNGIPVFSVDSSLQSFGPNKFELNVFLISTVIYFSNIGEPISKKYLCSVYYKADCLPVIKPRFDFSRLRDVSLRTVQAMLRPLVCFCAELWQFLVGQKCFPGK